MEGNESILDTGDFAIEHPSTPPPNSADSVKAKPEPKSEIPVGNDMQTSATVPPSATSDTISLRYGYLSLFFFFVHLTPTSP
jgi:hypothetical protein